MVIPKEELRVIDLEEVLTEETRVVGEFYDIDSEIQDKVSQLPISELSRSEAVRRIEGLENMKSPDAIPEGEVFEAIANALGTTREEIVRKRRQQREGELKGIYGLYYSGQGGQEIILLEDRQFSNHHVVGHEVVHAMRGAIKKEGDQADEKEGFVEGFALLARLDNKLEEMDDFLKIHHKIESGKVEVGFPGQVKRFFSVLGATHLGERPMSVDEAARIHFEEGDSLLSIQIASRVPEKLRSQVSEVLLKVE